MYFVISPTKDMKVESMQFEKSIPCMIEKSKILMSELQTLSIEEIMQSMKVNEKIASLNYERYKQFAYDEKGQAAIDTYHGLQFKQLALDTYNEKQLAYMNQHIRILSGLYGVLKPFDSIYPYRLEMMYKPFKLYDFWREDIHAYFHKQIVINVASNEYGSILEGDLVYHVAFKIKRNGKLVTQSTQAKMARGKFIDYVIKKQISDLEAIKQFDVDGYVYDEKLSENKVFVFIKNES